ncbi:hypothetical protein B0H13DRAFT_1896462 [Mycena leptocephala]|nr:hypothetical protein B0H13DRAFT_1896462 [Mycena leptocephala]
MTPIGCPWEDLARGLIVGNIDDNETSVSKACLSAPSDLPHLTRIEEHHLQAALATSTVRIPIPGSVQLVANYTELYPSDRWLDPSTYVQCTETISEACSAALIDHDYTYYMDEADKKWLDDTNHSCCVEEAAGGMHSGINQCGRIRACDGSQHQLSDFSFFQPFFQAPLHPDTFASHVVPAWITPPSVLTSIALIIHPHWRQRRSLRGGHKIFPLLNNDERDCISAAYSLKAGGPGQIGRLRMEFFDQRLANKHERLTKGSPKPRLQSTPQTQTQTEKEPAYATEGITISPPSIKEKTEQNGNANHNSLKTASSIPQHVIQSENVVIDLELSGRNIIPGKRQRTQSARAGDATAAKPPPKKPGLRDKEAAEAMNGCDGIGNRVEARIRGDGRREVVVVGSKTREVVFGSEDVGDLGDVVCGGSEARGATACREHVVGLQGTRKLGGPRILTPFDISYLEGLIQQTPDIYLVELQQCLFESTGLDVAQTTIRDALLRLGYMIHGNALVGLHVSFGWISG